MPNFDQLLQALVLVALLLYLAPALLRARRARVWSQRGAILTLGVATVVAAIASLLWFLR
ncbi:MAG TPA: hypothetical protein VME69_10600 [Methylocella sp.]|nr:hypothetical protein [Methylocella sp.]